MASALVPEKYPQASAKKFWLEGQVDGHTSIWGGGGGSDGHAFIIKLKFRHVKHFMIVLPLA